MDTIVTNETVEQNENTKTIKEVLEENGLLFNNNVPTEKHYQPIRFYSDEEKQQIDKILNKKYLVLFAGYVDDSETIEYKQWEFAKGRQKAYDLIVEIFTSQDLKDQGVTFDAYESRIIVESDSGKVRLNGVSVYAFMKKMKLEGLVEITDPNFDIEDWAEDAERNNSYEEE